MDLTSFIEKNGCECLNEADNHTLPQLLSKAGALESDCDEQVIAAIGAKFVSAVVCSYTVRGSIRTVFLFVCLISRECVSSRLHLLKTYYFRHWLQQDFTGSAFI